MKAHTSDGFDAEINVTPMIDVLLVLLVIFMLAQTGRYAFDVNVPPPRESDPRSPTAPPPIVLELPAGGGYALNGRAVVAGELPSLLEEVYRERRAAVLFIRAAAARPYRDVIEAADVARGAGVQVIGYMP